MKYFSPLAPGVLILFSAASAQTPETTIIRTETRTVLVDTVALDHKNNFIRDLTQKDFRVWEDGKEQKISSFSLENTGDKHYIVLFFDTSSLSSPKIASLRQDALEFIDRFATPDRFFAVVWYGAGSGSHIAQNFTTDAARLKAALGNIRGSSTIGMGSVAPNIAGPTRPTDSMNTADAVLYRNMLAGLRGITDSIAAIRGRKAVVAFSGGVNSAADFTAEAGAVIKAANKGNVAIYGISGTSMLASASSGTVLNSASPLVNRRAAPAVVSASGMDASNSPVEPSAANQNVARNLAEGTGGLMLATASDIANELGRIAQEQDEYYLIGYTPAVESAEGTCHTLQVKVARGGLDIRARKGYCTSKDEGAPVMKTAGRDLEARTSQPNISAAMQLPWLYPEPNVARVMLALDMLPTAIKFQKEKGRLHAEIELAGVAWKQDGATAAARLNDVIKLDFATQAEAEAFLKTPYHYTNTFEIAPGHYTFRLSIGAGDQAFGKTELPLVIEPYNGKAFALSALTLSHETHPSTQLTDGLDESLLIGAHPLVSQGLEIVPSGTNRFHKGERAYFYFEAYHPDPATLPVRVRILDRATGQQKDDSGALDVRNYIRPGNPTVPVGMAIPIAGLAPGAYKVEVSSNGVIRTADFDLN